MIIAKKWWSYLVPVLFPTTIVTAGALAPDIALSTGVETAEIFTFPRNDGFQEQVAVKLDPDPVANLFLHPVITTPEDLKVTFEATVTSAVIVEALLYVAVVAPPLSPKELKDEFRFTEIFPLVTGVALVCVVLELRAKTLKL